MRDVLLWVGLPASLYTVARVAWAFIWTRLKRFSPSFTTAVRESGDWIRGLAFSWIKPIARRRWVRTHAVRKYCRNLARSHEKLIVPGRGLPLAIDTCFIPLELRAGQMSEGGQLLDGTGAYLVLGDPGSGKSALLSRLVRTMCFEAIGDHQRARLPVYAPIYEVLPTLRRWEARRDKTLKLSDELTADLCREFLVTWFNKRFVHTLGLHDADDLLEVLAAQPTAGVVLMLDGLDETDVSDLALVEAFLVGVSRYLDSTAGRNLLIVTSRRQALEFTPRLVDGTVPAMDTVYLQPYTPAAIFSFLQRWPYAGGLDSDEEAQRIFTELRQNPTLLDSCSNPLFLTLYTSRDQRMRNQDEMVYSRRPETRAEFFSDVVGYLLSLRRSEREGGQNPRPAVGRSRHSFFVDLAMSHMESKETPNRISAALALEVLSRETELTNEEDLLRELQTMAKDSGIIVQNLDGTWSFIHAAFLNYFVGETLATTQGTKRPTDNLIGLLKKDPLRWVEGFYFACGLMAWRKWPALGNVLDKVGSNAEVVHLYPRACLEAQTYDRDRFVDNMKSLCRRWKSDHSQDQLLKDLVACLLDYERFCAALGQSPKISYKVQLREAINESESSSMIGPGLEVEVALRIAEQGDVIGLIEQAPVAESIIALYDPALMRDLDVNSAIGNPRVSATIAEAALRSSYLSGALGARKPNRFSLSSNNERWPDAWPIRESPLASLLSAGLPYVRGLDYQERRDFPHLFVLASTRPIRRLRYELVFGEWRITALALSGAFLLVALLLAIGIATSIAVAVLSVTALLTFLFARAAVLSGRVTLASTKLLNQQPARLAVGGALGRRVRQVRGDAKSLRAVKIGRAPRSSEGDVFAVYDRVVPLVWRRFCPAQGDLRVSLTAGADVQQFWTDDVRRLIGSR